MKIVVLSDIHGNLPALHTVTAHIEAWRPDFVFVNGDVVNHGPKPAACLRFVLGKQKLDDWQMSRGNHGEYVIDYARADAERNGRSLDINRPSYWTYQQLNGNVSAPADWPTNRTLAAPGGSVAYITHASRRG